jgi:SAM-dependent methyltransferase
MESADGYNYYDETRSEVLAVLDQLPKSSAVLDAGAGFGNNARELLARGHSVTATETSPTALLRLEQLRSDHPDRLAVRCQSVAELDDTGEFDAVICTMVLHYLTPQAGRDALERLKNATKPGGLCIVTSYLAASDLPNEYIWRLQPGELRAGFASWRILRYEESYPFTLSKIRSAPQLARWLRGRRGYKAARIVAQRPD